MDFKEYSSYKDSGVEWIGEIPSHWGIFRLDASTKIIRGNSSFTKDELLDEGRYVALQYGRTYKANEITESFKSYINEDFFKPTQIVAQGDTILISTSETIQDLGHSCFYMRKDIGLIGGEQFLLKPNKEKIIGKILYYKTKVFSSYLRKFATGTKVFRFNSDNLKSIHIPQIPIDEQTKIVAFLDTETSRIDNLIAKQEKLIEKLEEHRKSVISHAVTKGLNPNVPMKDSGVEWLGEVPEHWQLTKIKFLSTFVKGKNPEQLYNEKGKGMYSYLSMDYLRGKSSELFAPLTNNLTLVDDEQTLIIWDGSNAGEFVKAKQGILSSTMGAAFTKKVNKQFFWYLCLSIEPEIRKRTNGMGIPHVSGDFLKNFLVAMPNLGEQSKLAAYLDHETSKIDTLIAKQEKLIEKLKEYRTSIISHAVTGKIDVRDLVA